MAVATTKQIQQFIAPVLIFILLGGFIAGFVMGNPVAWVDLALLGAVVVLVVVLQVRKRRRASHSDADNQADTAAKNTGSDAGLSGRTASSTRPTPTPTTEAEVSVPVMTDDTVDSLTIRVMEQCTELGRSVPVSEAKEMAKKALSEKAASEQTQEPVEANQRQRS
jgi:hypothetical protein